VARNSEQERISEQKVRIADVIKKVIADAEIQAKAVEALRGQHRKILRPHLAVVEPGLVLYVAAENAPITANGVEGPLDRGRMLFQSVERLIRVENPIGEFKQSVHKPASVSECEHAAFVLRGNWQQGQRLRPVG